MSSNSEFRDGKNEWTCKIQNACFRGSSLFLTPCKVTLETLLGEFAIALFTEILTSCQKRKLEISMQKKAFRLTNDSGSCRVKNNNCVLQNDSLTLSKSFLFSLKRCFVCLWALLGRRNSDHMVRKKAWVFNSYQYKQYHHRVYVCILLWGWLSPCIKELVIKWFSSQKDSRSGTQNKLYYLFVFVRSKTFLKKQFLISKVNYSFNSQNDFQISIFQLTEIKHQCFLK